MYIKVNSVEIYEMNSTPSLFCFTKFVKEWVSLLVLGISGENLNFQIYAKRAELGSASIAGTNSKADQFEIHWADFQADLE